MIIKITLPKPISLVCGKPCPFCRFDFSDDNYHCLFNDDDPDDVTAINLHAEERLQYDRCPAYIVPKDKESIAEML